MLRITRQHEFPLIWNWSLPQIQSVVLSLAPRCHPNGVLLDNWPLQPDFTIIENKRWSCSDRSDISGFRKSFIAYAVVSGTDNAAYEWRGASAGSQQY